MNANFPPSGNGRYLSKAWLIGLLVTIILMLLGGAAKMVGDRYGYLESRVNAQVERDADHAREHGEFRAGIEDLQAGQQEMNRKLDRILERNIR